MIDNEIYIGVDIGGTNVKVGIIDRSGKIYVKDNFSTEAKNGFNFSINKIIEKIGALIILNKGKLMGIGVGVPGLIDSEVGEVKLAANLNWEKVNLKIPLEKAFNVPVKINNDANVAALGESTFGASKNYNTSVMLTLGTGVGSGIIIDGKIYSGNKSAGAEIGHMIIEADGRYCTCGNYGCFEAYASASALKLLTKTAMEKNTQSKMYDECLPSTVSGKTAFKFAEIDETAKQVVENYLKYLSIGIINIANIFRPEAIILGGGVSQEGDKLLNPLKDLLKKYIFAKELGPKVELKLAELKNDAGFMGAAALNF